MAKQQMRKYGIFVSDKGYLPEPIDLAILKLLPDEGTKFNQYFWDGRRVGQLIKALGPEGLTSEVITGRMRIMRAEGLVAPVPGSKRGAHGDTGRRTGGQLWVRTAAGAALAAEEQ